MTAISPYQPRFVEFLTASAGTALTLDFSANGFIQAIPLSAASCTLTITPPKAVTAWIILRIIQDATGGRVVVWPASVKGPAPTLSIAANASDVVALFWNGTNLYFQAAAPVTTGVSSFNTRTGAVVPAASDYAASQVSNDSTVTGSTVAAALNTLKAASGVASVFGRIGAVVAVAGDYAASKINNDSATVSGTHVSDALDALKTLIAGGVSSVFGRTGVVVAVAGDYAASKINNDSATVAGTHVSDALDTLKALIAAAVTGVSSWNSRTGAVVPASGDYAASLVTNDSSVTGATVKDALQTLKAASGVASVFGRIGAVVPVAGDYAASKINNDSATVSGTHVSDALDALKALSGVTSVFGRTGAILAVAGDYVASKINNDSTVTGTHVSDALNTLKAASGVSSVFGRTGAVVAVAGDYAASKVNNDSATVSGTHVSDALDQLLLAYQAVPTETASRTLALTDVGKLLLANSAGAMTYTVPPNASVAFKIGTRISALVIGSGTVLGFAAGIGVTINVPAGLSVRRYTRYQIEKIGTDTWYLTTSGAFYSNDIADASNIGGPTVLDSLNAMFLYATSLTSSQVANASTVAGTSISDALNTLFGQLTGDISVPIAAVVGSNWGFGTHVSGFWQGNGAGGDIWLSLGPIPPGRSISGVKVAITPTSGHGALPSIMPSLRVYRSNPATIGTAMALQTNDSSASVGAYEAGHQIINTFTPTTGNQTSFWAKLTDEGGTGTIAGLCITNVTITLQ